MLPEISYAGCPGELATSSFGPKSCAPHSFPPCFLCRPLPSLSPRSHCAQATGPLSTPRSSRPALGRWNMSL